MKIINELVICEIPKGADNIRIETILGSPVFKYDYTLDGFVPLPSGYEYECIGLYDEACHTPDIWESLEELLATKTLYDTLRSNGLMPRRENTDLLFIKRIKKH